MLGRLVAWAFGLPLALAALLFAVANRHDVRLELWPLPWVADLPVYLAVLGALTIGMVVGAMAVLLSGLSWRKTAQDERRRAQSLERQLAALAPPPGS